MIKCARCPYSIDAADYTKAILPDRICCSPTKKIASHSQFLSGICATNSWLHKCSTLFFVVIRFRIDANRTQVRCVAWAKITCLINSLHRSCPYMGTCHSIAVRFYCGSSKWGNGTFIWFLLGKNVWKLEYHRASSTVSISHSRTVSLKLEQQSTNTKHHKKSKRKRKRKKTHVGFILYFSFHSFRHESPRILGTLCALFPRRFLLLVDSVLFRCFLFSVYLHFYRKIHVMRVWWVCVCWARKHCTAFTSIECVRRSCGKLMAMRNVCVSCVCVCSVCPLSCMDMNEIVR